MSPATATKRKQGPKSIGSCLCFTSFFLYALYICRAYRSKSSRTRCFASCNKHSAYQAFVLLAFTSRRYISFRRVAVTVLFSAFTGALHILRNERCGHRPQLRPRAESNYHSFCSFRPRIRFSIVSCSPLINSATRPICFSWSCSRCWSPVCRVSSHNNVATVSIVYIYEKALARYAYILSALLYCAKGS
ncbi:uncharacterized protein EV420DRAFT_1575780 [Desarmillaria tabescens]|uniref:Uncharacterized protein n=1 Tax=Armillaria tabescens TaxID=1929756 RepID=A0AA39MRW1_ARMTA|nr:uncharacterized protein EV420DRAFT_1575780 [Desarmillaria tabescens]KAK0443973.1 hypothetical protein EV420DRAFT_1575780 [Desarmillaria tabescens]